MQDIYFMCVLGLAEDLEARVLKSSPQTKAPGNTPRAKACKTTGAGRWVWSESVPTENPIIESMAIFETSYQASILTTCNYICTRETTVLLYEYRHLIGDVCGLFGICNQLK